MRNQQTLPKEPKKHNGAQCNSPIGSGNRLNMYLNPRVHGSIPTEGKNSTSEGGGEDRKVIVPGAPVPGAPKTWSVTRFLFSRLVQTYGSYGRSRLWIGKPSHVVEQHFVSQWMQIKLENFLNLIVVRQYVMAWQYIIGLLVVTRLLV
jgi:hypothetical protein